MKPIKLTLIVLFISFPLQGLLAQKIFRDGYIVKKSGESLTGLVEYSVKQDIPSECIFKRFDIARAVVYSPNDILAFGYRNGNRYESRETDGKNSFYEVIVTGKIILYQKGSKFYIDKDHLGFVELKAGTITYNSGTGNREYKSLSEFLGFITEGKAGPVAGKFNLRNEIVPLIISYNKESAKSYYVFNRSISEKQLSQEAWKSGVSKNSFGVISGVNIYMLNLKFNPNMYGITSNNYVPNPGKEMGLVTGLTYERLLSRKTDRLSARISLLYTNQSFYCYGERANNAGGITRDDANFSFTGIKIPVLFQYSLTGGRIVPYLNAGVAYQYLIRTDYMHNAEIENTLHEISTYEDSNMLFRAGEITGLAGLGIRTRMFNNLNLHLMFLFEAGQGLFLNTDPTDTNYRTNKPYVQNSLQSSMLIGITF